MNHLAVSQPVNKLALVCLASRPDYDDHHIWAPTICGRMFFGNLGWKKPEKSNSVLFVILVFPHIDFPRAEIYCDDDVEDGDDDGDNDIHDDSVLPHIQLPRAEIRIARKTMERHCDDDDGDDDDSDDDDDGDNDNDDDGDDDGNDDDGCKQ